MTQYDSYESTYVGWCTFDVNTNMISWLAGIIKAHLINSMQGCWFPRGLHEKKRAKRSQEQFVKNHS